MGKKNWIKEEGYYMVHSFMIQKLKLKGIELQCYAIIFGFSQAEGQTFNAPLQYLIEWTCASKRALISALAKLVEKGLLRKSEKIVNGNRHVSYVAITPSEITQDEDGVGKESLPGGEETSLGGEETSPGGEKSSPNNKNYNKNDNKNYIKEDSPSLHSEESKKPGGGAGGHLGWIPGVNDNELF